MCGIAGIFRPDGLRADDARAIQAMTRILAHRGPDDEAIWHDERIALGHRRLAVIDPEGGAQPVASEDGRIQIIFNGEIYNHRELREQLAAKGHVFKSRCDAEVLPHAYEQWGERFTEHLVGMFAIAVYDSVRRRLLLVRDRLGVKPLYWARSGNAVLFGSEAKAILHGPGAAEGEPFPRRVDLDALHGCLTYRYVPDCRSGFLGIESVAPATLVTVDGAGSSASSTYWQLPELNSTTSSSSSVIDLLEHAVSCRLESDVPIGSFLSGGIDSALVTGLMARQQADVHAFSIGFEESGYDETADASAAARQFGVHHEMQTVRAEVTGILPAMVWACDEPFADSSMAPTYQLCRWARQHITVALSGDGGDEAFGGYRRYKGVPLAARAAPFAGLLGAILPASVRRRLRAAPFGQGLMRSLDWLLVVTSGGRRTLGEIFAASHGHQDGVDDLGMWSVDARSRISSPGSPYAELIDADHSASPIRRMTHADTRIYLPHDILTKVDRASMAHGLEVRSPLLDHRLVEWAHSLKESVRMPGGRRKGLLRAAAASFLPIGHFDRPKRGFGIPVDAWMRGQPGARARETVLEGELAGAGYLNVPAIAELFDRHASRRARLGERLWTLLCMELWHRTFIGGASVPDSPTAW